MRQRTDAPAKENKAIGLVLEPIEKVRYFLETFYPSILRAPTYLTKESRKSKHQTPIL